MMDRILSELLEIEKQFGVKILYAVEAGSRAWGYGSDKSDYDIRFIYVHPVRHYLSLQHTKDVIEVEVNNQMEFVGWDVKKALSLLHKSNPSILEWLTEENIYSEHEVVWKVRNLAERGFSRYKVLHHYISMAKKNINTKSLTDVKYHLNVIRPFLSCLWLEQFHSFPPNHICLVMKHLDLENQIKKDIEKVLNMKKQGINEMDDYGFQPMVKQIDQKLTELKNQIINNLSGKTGDIKEFDDVLLYILEEVWKVDGLYTGH